MEAIRSASILALALLSSGCSGVLAKDNGRAFGEDIGRFRIDATLTKSTCGPGAAGTGDDVKLEVFFSRDPPNVYWNTGGDAVEGTLEADGMHFSFESQTVVAMPGAESPAATCTMVRNDDATGAFDDAHAARNITGVLEYRFAAQGRSDCSAAMAEQGFSALPCAMSYRMKGAYVSPR